MPELGVKTLLAYLLGALPGALVLGLAAGVDIRTQGSGNAGATNALRTRGARFALAVLAIDLGKGVVGAALLPRLPWPGADPDLDRAWLASATAAAVVVGHVYPVWFGFRGGKGVATLAGALGGLAPGFLAVLLGLWLAVLGGTRLVSLASVVAAAGLPLVLIVGAALGLTPHGQAFVALFVFALFAALLTAYTHRANLARLRAGTEPRLARRAAPGRPR